MNAIEQLKQETATNPIMEGGNAPPMLTTYGYRGSYPVSSGLVRILLELIERLEALERQAETT
jgi:hypothetical protein